jgi:uncharacterized integral membrane protein
VAVTEGRSVSEGRSTPEEPDAGRVPSPSAAAPRAVERTRVSVLWTAVAVGAVVLAAILIFIAQNSTSVRVHFLMGDFELPLGVALLFAALLGAILVLAVGTVRILQLRRVARRHRRAAAR